MFLDGCLDSMGGLVIKLVIKLVITSLLLVDVLFTDAFLITFDFWH